MNFVYHSAKLNIYCLLLNNYRHITTILSGARAHRNRCNRHMNRSIIIVMPLPALIMAVTVSFSRPVTPVSAITVFM